MKGLAIALFIAMQVVLYTAVHATAFSFNNALVDAADRGLRDQVVILLKKGHSPDSEGDFRVTALMRAAYRGHNDVVKILIDSGAYINAADIGGATALHLAARQGHLDTVKLLIEQGATIDAPDKERWTPLMRAVMAKQQRIAKHLIKSGADITRVNQLDESVMVHAATVGLADILKDIMDHKDIDDIPEEQFFLANSIAKKRSDTIVQDILKLSNVSLGVPNLKPVDLTGSNEIEPLPPLDMLEANEPVDDWVLAQAITPKKEVKNNNAVSTDNEVFALAANKSQALKPQDTKVKEDMISFSPYVSSVAEEIAPENKPIEVPKQPLSAKSVREQPKPLIVEQSPKQANDIAMPLPPAASDKKTKSNEVLPWKNALNAPKQPRLNNRLVPQTTDKGPEQVQQELLAMLDQYEKQLQLQETGMPRISIDEDAINQAPVNTGLSERNNPLANDIRSAEVATPSDIEASQVVSAIEAQNREFLPYSTSAPLAPKAKLPTDKAPKVSSVPFAKRINNIPVPVYKNATATNVSKKSQQVANNTPIAAQPTLKPQQVSNKVTEGELQMQLYYYLQLGAFANEKIALDNWQLIKASQNEVLGSFYPHVVEAFLSRQVRPVFRLRVGPFITKNDAQRVCKLLREGNIECFIVESSELIGPAPKRSPLQDIRSASTNASPPVSDVKKQAKTEQYARLTYPKPQSPTPPPWVTANNQSQALALQQLGENLNQDPVAEVQEPTEPQAKPMVETNQPNQDIAPPNALPWQNYRQSVPTPPKVNQTTSQRTMQVSRAAPPIAQRVPSPATQSFAPPQPFNYQPLNRPNVAQGASVRQNRAVANVDQSLPWKQVAQNPAQLAEVMTSNDYTRAQFTVKGPLPVLKVDALSGSVATSGVDAAEPTKIIKPEKPVQLSNIRSAPLQTMPGFPKVRGQQSPIVIGNEANKPPKIITLSRQELNKERMKVASQVRSKKRQEFFKAQGQSATIPDETKPENKEPQEERYSAFYREAKARASQANQQFAGSGVSEAIITPLNQPRRKPVLNSGKSKTRGTQGANYHHAIISNFQNDQAAIDYWQRMFQFDQDYSHLQSNVTYQSGWFGRQQIVLEVVGFISSEDYDMCNIVRTSGLSCKVFGSKRVSAGPDVEVPGWEERAEAPKRPKHWIMLGTFSNRSDAEFYWMFLQEDHSQILQALKYDIGRAQKHGEFGDEAVKLRIGPFYEKGRAVQTCDSLSKRNISCLVN